MNKFFRLFVPVAVGAALSVGCASSDDEGPQVSSRGAVADTGSQASALHKVPPSEVPPVVFRPGDLVANPRLEPATGCRFEGAFLCFATTCGVGEAAESCSEDALEPASGAWDFCSCMAQCGEVPAPCRG